jgi:hypothetical protein
MTVTSIGVGIGTSVPVARLDVSGGDPCAIFRHTAGTAAIRVVSGAFSDLSGIRLYQSSTDQGLYTSNLLPMTFITNALERVRITSAGNVGIGTTTPAATTLLDVNGNARVAGDVQGNAFFSQQFTTGSIANGGSAVITAWSNVMPTNATAYSGLVAVVANIAGSFGNVGGALYAVVQHSTGTYGFVQLAQATNGGIAFTTTSTNISLSNTAGSTQSFNVNFTVLGSNR